MKETYSEVLKVRITPSQLAMLERMAKTYDMNVSDAVRKAVETYWGAIGFADSALPEPQKSEQPRS